MRGIHWVLIGLAAALVVLVIYVIFFKPVLVLPPVVVMPPANSPLHEFQQQLGINELDVQIRTDGKIVPIADGEELGTVTYTPATLSHSIDLASKMLLPPSNRTAIRLIPILFPGLASNLALTSLIAYHVLPIQFTVRFLGG